MKSNSSQFSLSVFQAQQQKENEKLLSCMRSLVESHTDKSVGIRYCKSSECVDMNHEITDQLDGTRVCPYCGTSYGQVLDLGAEWRFYGADDRNGDPSRAEYGYNECLPTASLYTSFSGRWKSQSDVGRMAGQSLRWQNFNSKEFGVKEKFNKIQSACFGHLPQNIISNAKYTFFTLSEERSHYGKTILRKSNLTATMASAVYFSCKSHNKDIRFKELGDWFGVDEHDIQSTVKNFLKNDTYHNSIDISSTTWKELLHRYCTLCGIHEHYNEVRQFVVQAEELGLLHDKTPQTICAGAIYVVCTIKHGYDTSKKHIYDKCKMSDATLQRCVVCFMDNLSDLVFVD
jgi:transcription initiation factor TFIIIB Brf1 subunit/transcription initiation factor TFIIB